MIEIINHTELNDSPRIKAILGRQISFDQDTDDHVRKIIADVQQNGDEALFRLTELFDAIALNESNLRVEPELIDSLAEQVPDSILEVLREAIANVRAFHQHQIQESWSVTDDDGVTLGQRIMPLESVGLYVPGGKAAYPSSVIMNAVPALLAGVKRIAVVTPPGTLMQSPIVAAALKELGLCEVYSVGGAQAVAALAYGTQTIPRVDKIVGPGNIYVATAKRLVFGAVGIDNFAGPSEIVILADETAKAHYVAADLLSQAEHDTRASAICITTSQKLAKEVREQLEAQLETLNRADIAEASLKEYGAIVVFENLHAACGLINLLAPEHLEVMVADPEPLLERIHNVGAIFIGEYSSEPVGDYFAGPNHILPTAGTARFSSPLGVPDFVKRTNVIKYTKAKLLKTGESIERFARAEGLDAHARAITARLYDQKKEESTGELPEQTSPF